VKGKKMMWKNRLYWILPAAVVVVALLFIVFTGGEDKTITPERFKEYKLAKRGGDTSKKPSEWFTLQRAYPYDDIPFDAYKRALNRAQELRRADVALQIGIWIEAGPSNVGGRITDVAMHPDYPDLIYAGAALGGVFKSIDGGVTWTAVSDAVPSLSVGDIEVDPNDPDILYFGTGEANASGDSYAGTGMYKTTDGGASWDFIGLPESRHIGRIVIDPINTQRIFVAAMGTLFGTNPDRGVYRSTDGGESWEQVLFVTDSTGAADLAINPQNPDIVYAAMWERIRGPDHRRVGGLTTGIWRTTDGGDNWEHLTNGLPSPSTTNGRIGLAISPADPDYVYASMVDHPGYVIGMWRTTDGGDSWQSRLVSPDPYDFSGFGWYFGRIWAHPTNRETVYFGDVAMWKSTDGAANWYDIMGTMHVDMHGLYQDPGNPNYIVVGNDGGMFISHNGGSSWTKCYDLPITQFYAITIDQLNPHRLYGGTQDNSTPRTLDGEYDNWDVIFYGDGFYCNVDFTNSNVIYAEAQYGYLGKSVNLGQYWSIITDGIDGSERVNWMMPVVMSPHNNDILYCGTERVYETVNGGDWWNAISPDLTGGGGHGNLIFGTITTIGVSPISDQIIWAGTDDSRVWVTTDRGSNWNMVSEDLPDRWCTRVTPDVFNQATAYASFSGYKIDELLPHIFKTTDYGATWTDISGDLVDIPINDILPDPLHPGWLYAGTDFGVFYTTDGGDQWRVLGDNHPICPVFDMDLHSVELKLVSGTHGRSMYTYDLTQLEGPDCQYIAGDADHNGTPLELSDLIVMISAYRGMAEPNYTCSCPPHGDNFAPEFDPDGDCVALELNDVVHMIAAYRGLATPTGCQDCPGMR
jgi:photosystem II stability/assembly factor-like uncharacterized protein